VSANHETTVETARRHVREGEERMARQAALVAGLVRDRRHEAATLGRLVLMTMHASLDLMRGHLRQIERRSKRTP
jgi:hypothetical protein